MATPKPLYMKKSSFKLGNDAYEGQVSQVQFVPSSTSAEWKGLDGNAYTNNSTATWTVSMTLIQNWNDLTSLSNYLFDNEGNVVTATFIPENPTDAPFTAEVVLTPGAIGGSVDAWAESTVTLSCVGRPTRGAIPTPPAGQTAATTK